MKENEETLDEANIRNFIDAFIVEMRKGTDDSFTVRFELFHHKYKSEMKRQTRSDKGWC